MHKPIALYSGRPVLLSQTIVVSRWLVIPIATSIRHIQLKYQWYNRIQCHTVGSCFTAALKQLLVAAVINATSIS